MEDMNDMLGSLLSDPESMQQIKELADMLKSDGLTAEPDAPAAKEAEAPQEDDPFASLFAKGEKK